MANNLTKSNNREKILTRVTEMPDYKIARTTNGKNKVIETSFSGRKGNRVFSGKFTETEHGSSVTLSNYTVPRRKADYKSEIEWLHKNEHLTQSEIARRLGISQPYVSILLNS